MSDRGLSPIVGSVLLVALAVGLASVAVLGVTGVTASEPPPRVQLTASASAATDRITIAHAGGDALDPAALRVRISVDGDPLAHQPPVPFFSATGFISGPTGPFNPATDGPWTAGQRATLRLASTNAPLLDPGDRVTVTVSRGETTVAERTVRAE